MRVELSVVVPCYNEEPVLEHTTARLLELFDSLVACKKISGRSKIYFVDDGSKDRTWELINALSKKHRNVVGIKLSRNRGHQNALLAGLFTAEGDVLVSIDADLQDDVNAIQAMLEEYERGSEIVYGVREKRTVDTPFKRLTALGFYKMMKALGVDVVHNHADYRLMSRRAVENLKNYTEVNLFLRGIVPLIGFSSSIIYYDRKERFAGESKYPLKKMLAFALEGITSFSVTPLRFVTAIGGIVFSFSILISMYAIFIRLFTDRAIPGWASTVLPLYLLGGIQILCIGIIGEYTGKIYKETKNRPRYIIERITKTESSSLQISPEPSHMDL